MPIDQKTRSRIEEVITPLLTQGIPAEQVAAGIRAWEASDMFSPTHIPAFVHKAGIRATTPGFGGTSSSGQTSKAQMWASIATDLAARDATEPKELEA